MDGCNSWGQFWVALPLTLPAIGALWAAIRNGHKTDRVATSVNGHMTELKGKAEAYEAVIDDLSQRLADAEPEA